MAGSWPEQRAGHAVSDLHGRGYLLGPSDRVLLGHSRGWLAAAAWAAMLAVSGTQYGYGVFAARLGHGTAGAMGWGFALWVACQSLGCAALPALRRRYGLTPAKAVLAGALGCALGMLALGRPGPAALSLTVYGMTAGLGAGLVYGACMGCVASWYPERPARTALVSGAFGYGAVPVILAVAGTGRLAPSFDVLAWVIVAIAAPCAPLLREPPARWWPPQPDPRRWAVDKALNPALRHDPPAARVHSPAQAVRSRAALVMAALALTIWAASLFDIACLPSFCRDSGWSLSSGAIALAAFAAGSGGIRALAVKAASRAGLRRVIAAGTVAGAAAQLALAAAGAHHALALAWLASGVAGAAAGTWNATLPELVGSLFGDQPGLPNLWLAYSAKAAGGLLAVGGLASLAAAAGYPAALAASAALLAIAGALVPLLRRRRPGLPRTLPVAPPAVAARAPMTAP
jgi:hypothetical protein